MIEEPTMEEVLTRIRKIVAEQHLQLGRSDAARGLGTRREAEESSDAERASSRQMSA